MRNRLVNYFLAGVVAFSGCSEIKSVRSGIVYREATWGDSKKIHVPLSRLEIVSERKNDLEWYGRCDYFQTQEYKMDGGVLEGDAFFGGVGLRYYPFSGNLKGLGFEFGGEVFNVEGAASGSLGPIKMKNHFDGPGASLNAGIDWKFELDENINAFISGGVVYYGENDIDSVDIDQRGAYGVVGLEIEFGGK